MNFAQRILLSNHRGNSRNTCQSRGGNYQNVATSAKLTDLQKQLITTVADKYAPGWKKAGETLDAVKQLPGF